MTLNWNVLVLRSLLLVLGKQYCYSFWYWKSVEVTVLVLTPWGSVQQIRRKSHNWIPAPSRNACHSRPKITAKRTQRLHTRYTALSFVSLSKHTRYWVFPTRNRKSDLRKTATCAHWKHRLQRRAALALLSPSKKFSQHPLTQRLRWGLFKIGRFRWMNERNGTP